MRQRSCGTSPFNRGLVGHRAPRLSASGGISMVLKLFLWGASKQRDRRASIWAGNMGWERASALQPSMRLQVRPRPHDGPVVRRGDRSGRLAQVRRGPFETRAPECKAPSKASAVQYLHLHRPIKTAFFWAPQIQCHARCRWCARCTSTSCTCTCTCCCCCSWFCSP